MNLFVRQVIEFNEDLLDIQRPDTVGIRKNVFDHLFKAKNEEFRELEDAVRLGSIVDAVDALIDDMYFTIGGLHKMGLTDEQIDACMTAVHEANMQKRRGVVARRQTDGIADAVKPEGWKSPEERIKEILGL